MEGKRDVDRAKDRQKQKEVLGEGLTRKKGEGTGRRNIETKELSGSQPS